MGTVKEAVSDAAAGAEAARESLVTLGPDGRVALRDGWRCGEVVTRFDR